MGTERTFHNDAAAKYMLPNDAPEHSRLEEQSVHLSSLMNGKILHAPLPRGDATSHTILDIGCGTGYVTRTLAVQFPNAQVYGLDLSPVPLMHNKLTNVTFLQGNFVTQAPATWVAHDGSGVAQDKNIFDLTFSRLLIAGMSDWSNFFTREWELLKPGGWAETHEMTNRVYDADGTMVSRQWAYWQDTGDSCQQIGLDFQCGPEAEARMKKAGFVDTHVKVYHIPWGGEDQTTPEMKALGDFWILNLKSVFELLMRTLEAKGIWTAEKTDRGLAEMHQLLVPKPGRYSLFYVTYARKPE